MMPLLNPQDYLPLRLGDVVGIQRRKRPYVGCLTAPLVRDCAGLQLEYIGIPVYRIVLDFFCAKTREAII